MNYNNEIGLEEFQWKVFRAVYSNVNAEIDTQETAGNTGIDAAYDALTGRSFGSLSIERVNSSFIHFGHRPSMVEAPVSEYPSIAVSSGRATKIAPRIDQANTLANAVAVELIVKSDPFPADGKSGVGEDQVDRRLKRTIEAVNAAVIKNSGLASYDNDGPTSVICGEIFARKAEAGQGDQYFWQGARLEYVFTKQNVGGFDAAIDQA